MSLTPPVVIATVHNRLPSVRDSKTHKFSIAGHDGYITVGLYENGTPGEIFIRMAKEGSTIAGLMDCFAVVTSIALQHGVPLDKICKKMKRTRFDPSGFTGNPEIHYASSIMDYIFTWLENKFLETLPEPLGSAPTDPAVLVPEEKKDESGATWAVESDAPACVSCGGLTRRAGSCYLCQNCGATSGCS